MGRGRDINRSVHQADRVRSDNIQVAVTDSQTIDTSSGDLVLDAVAGSEIVLAATVNIDAGIIDMSTQANEYSFDIIGRCIEYR